MTPFEPATASGGMGDAQIVALSKSSGLSVAVIREQVAYAKSREMWMNDTYQVAIDREWGDWIHLSIKRIDKEPIHDWRHLQKIKNELIGPEFEVIELYPAESRLVDSANQYHLWVIADPSFRVPVGWSSRFVMGPDPDSNAKQRPFEEE